jgi:hypothetical protein
MPSALYEKNKENYKRFSLNNPDKIREWGRKTTQTYYDNNRVEIQLKQRKHYHYKKECKIFFNILLENEII